MTRVYYLAFGYSDKWYNKCLKGYTHVALIAQVNGVFLGLNPLHSFCRIEPGDYLQVKGWETVLKVRVRHTRANRLIRLGLQTCATFVQYVMGISTGALLCQTLYDRLMTKKYEGIEVSIWQQKDILTLS